MKDTKNQLGNELELVHRDCEIEYCANKFSFLLFLMF